MISRRVPEAVIRRLPKYYAKLCELEAQGVIRISSMQLSQKMGLNASQIRQDLNYFGGFGQQGYGYIVENLRENLGDILGLFKSRTMVIVGCGNIGCALANYSDFARCGFSIIKMFDKNKNLVGEKIGDIQVEDIDFLGEFLSKNKVDIGVIAVPKQCAQSIADIFIQKGVKGIWNFAPVDIEAKDTVIEDVRLNDSLFALNYKMINEIYD